MTEDDTIRVLKRISFYDMMKLYRSNMGMSTPANPDEWAKWFAEYGWTWPEFSKHWVEWNDGRSTYSDHERITK